MRALVFDGKLALRDIDKPIPNSGEALIRVTLAGICGTDTEILKGYSAFRGVMGHEFVGRVVESADSAWIGERVVGEINIACGECSWCFSGLGRHCPHRTVMGIVSRAGCFAEYVALPLRNLHRVPAAIPDEAAVFVEPLAAAAEILEQMRLEPGTRVVVLGDGRLGLLVAQVLKSAGAQVILVGKHGWKLDLARPWGVRVMTDSKSELQAASVPVVVEATGSPRGLAEAFRLVEPRGTVRPLMPPSSWWTRSRSSARAAGTFLPPWTCFSGGRSGCNLCSRKCFHWKTALRHSNIWSGRTA